MNITKKDINDKPIYFLDDLNFEHDNLQELNESNTELYINNKKYKYKKYFIPEKEGEYEIYLKFNINLTDCSYMFAGCGKIKYIDFTFFNTINIINMKYMFYKCKNLKYINLFSPDIRNVTDMRRMFYECSLLEFLPDISKWDIRKVKDLSEMFLNCKSLKSLPGISKWDMKNVNDMSNIF